MTILCLHGLRRTPVDWDGVRGGLERVAPVRAPTVPADPRAALVAVGADLQPDDIVIGHSMGGVVALELAAARPLRAIVLTGCFFPFARNGRALAPSLVDYAAHRVAYARAVARRRVPGRPAPGAARDLPALARRGLRLLREGTPPVRSTTPVLVIHARDDHHVPVDFALAALAAHPAWAAAILDRGGHHLHVEDPDGWLGAAMPWLRATAPRAV